MNKPPGQFLDTYNINARLKPALLTILPLGAVAVLMGLGVSIVTGAIAGPLSIFGFTALLSQVAREFGSRKEPALFADWGGKPSVAKLRHRDLTLNQHTKARYHMVASRLLGRPMPTVAEELKDPGEADSVYEAYSNLLLERTRDKQRFPLVFEELTNYGFRRNLWGMKPIGCLIVLGSLTVQFVYGAFSFYHHARLAPVNLALLLMNLALSLCWVFVINPSWVKGAADAYAVRLLAASEQLTSYERGMSV